MQPLKVIYYAALVICISMNTQQNPIHVFITEYELLLDYMYIGKVNFANKLQTNTQL